MMSHLSAAVVIVILVFGCSPKPSSYKSKESIDLVRSDSVVLEQGEQLFGKFYEHMKISPAGDFWLFNDRIRNQVFVFNNDGSFHSVIGKSGRGPKELLTVSSYDINKDKKIAIVDLRQRMLKIFDLNGTLISSNNILENVDFSLLPHHIEWFGNKLTSTIIDIDAMFEQYNSRLLVVMNNDGSPDTVFGKFDPFTKQDNRENFVSLLAIDDEKGLAYTNLQSSPYFQVYNLENLQRVHYGGEKTEAFNMPVKKITRHSSISEIKELSENTSVFAHIFLTDKYFIQHMQILTEEWFDTSDYSTKKNILIFYDRKTNTFLQEIPVNATPLAIHNGKIFSIENFDPDHFTIGIYEIKSKTE